MPSSSKNIPAEEQTVHSTGRSGTPDVRFIHYNDVYHIEYLTAGVQYRAGSADPVGGISRFRSVCNYYRSDEAFAGQPQLLTFFSGDAYNPSLESSVTKGAHMVPVLNQMGTDVACVGNHDLDFGVTQFRHLAAKCNFPWLLANVLDPALGQDVPLGNANKTVMLTASNGIKIGVIGLVEREWLDTINSLPPDLIYKSATATAKELVPKLREQGAEMIIAVTHAREPNDDKLAKQIPPGLIDIILGGHDHFYQHKIISQTHILRSGTDFKQLSYLKAWRKESGWDIDIIRRDIVRSLPEDAEAAALVEKISSGLRSKLEKPIGYTAAPLDARFTTVRLKESNLANFVCDLMRSYYSADCAIMAAGTVRGDQVYQPGLLKLKDIMACFPFEDPVVVIRAKGKAIWDALENGVSQYPALEGRFPQVSNINLHFDPDKPSGSRIQSVDIGGKPVDNDKLYVLATRDYMIRGKDGYSSLLCRSAGGENEELVSDENGMILSMILRQYFQSIKTIGKWKRLGPHMRKHWDAVHDDVHSKHPVKEAQSNLDYSAHYGDTNGQSIESDSEDEHIDGAPISLEGIHDTERRSIIMRKVLRKWFRLAGLEGHPGIGEAEGEFTVGWTKSIAPRLEGRIKMVGTTV